MAMPYKPLPKHRSIPWKLLAIAQCVAICCALIYGAARWNDARKPKVPPLAVPFSAGQLVAISATNQKACIEWMVFDWDRMQWLCGLHLDNEPAEFYAPALRSTTYEAK